MSSEATRIAAPDLPQSPLAGIRVLDLTRLLPGPMCTLYFADLGADVIKIEDTLSGDYARTLNAPPGRVSAFYRAINRNKRSLAVDLKHGRGRAAFLALAKTADVLVESFRPGVVASLGVDFAAVSAVSPDIVYCSLSGYGQSGPRAPLAGHDINYLGYAGVLDQTGVRGGAPALSNLQIADLLGGAASAAIAILGALVGRLRGGGGRFIDVAMADASLAHNIFPLASLEDEGEVAARGDALLTGGVPCYGVYPTGDGRFLAVGALEPKFWQALCRALERPDLLAGQLARGDAGARVREALEAIFAQHPLAHWVEQLGGVDCCVTPVLTLAEALDDPQFRARGMTIETSDGSRQLAPPFKISDSFSLRRLAPRQGEHSVEVLREAGFDTATIDELERDGVTRIAR